MKKDQKLFELFRKNEHKLHEYPSDDAWRRLEKRLDAHRKRRRITTFRPIAMAAALVLLVGMVALFTWVSDTLQQSNKRAHPHFVLLEDLPPSEDNNFYAQNLAIRERYDQTEVDEGDSQKRFRVNQPRQEPALTATKRLTETPGIKKKFRDPPLEVDYSRVVKEEEQAEKMEQLEEMLADHPMYPEKAADQVETRPAEAATYSDTAPNAAAAESRSAVEETPFDWLIGTWESEDQDPPVFEEWSYQNSQQLRGVTYKLSNNQKEILEELEIRQINGTWNYNSPREGAFQLQSQEPDQAVFSNAMPNRANNVILQRNGNEEFSTILQYEMSSDTLLRKRNDEVRRMRRKE